MLSIWFMNVYVENAIHISSTTSIFYRPKDKILVKTSSARGKDKAIFLKICVMISYHASSTTVGQPRPRFFLLGQILGLQPRFPFDQNMYRISIPSMTHSRNGPTHFVHQISQVQLTGLQSWMVEQRKEQPEPPRHQKRNQMHWNVPWKVSWTT